MRISGNENLKD